MTTGVIYACVSSIGQSQRIVASHAASAPEYTGTNAQCGGKRGNDG